MSTVAVAINVQVVLRDGLSPLSTSLELGVVDVDTSVNHVDVDAFTASRVVLVLGEGAEAELLTVTDPCETLNRYDRVVSTAAGWEDKIEGRNTYPRSCFLRLERMYDLIVLNVINLRLPADELDNVA